MPDHLLLFMVVGFAAQMIDGALGMAYGVSCTTFLLSFGVPPAAASASVHAAEIFTTGVSGLSHFHFGNVDRSLFRRLVVPGVIGGVLGAYALSELPGERIRPFVYGYLLVMGVLIIARAFAARAFAPSTSWVPGLGLAGGFLDAVGGGGWGPVVTSTLVARGNRPREVIGSVNLAEFFVTVAQTATFFLTIGIVHWKLILGLILGGMAAAPFAAYVCRWIPTRAFMVAVGLLIVALSVRTLSRTLF